MKTLKNHIILYDAECPMCKLYTNAFIKTGMLDTAGRVAYQQMPESVCPYVDRQRAINEIALVDTKTGEVKYGIHSLFKVIAHSFPGFKALFSFAPFIWLTSKLYAFISYNRRVIIPADINNQQGLQPTFKLRYRIAYLIFTWAIVGFILTAYARLLTGFVPLGNSFREYLICGGQIIFQGIVISIYAQAKRWEYLGNMMTISFAGSLLLIPMLFLPHLLPAIYPLYFMAVAGLMFLEHIRRTKLLQLGWLLTITWVIYRIAVLILILKF
ncbi:MAG TPA: DCC1-like thiol-disulfide oxidoreductase family protein [Mucilaginibacter sp.]|nr:DCC1-like thiol-disulfide oxidoreductase family protein [Mucilaginibacter sp.]